jgi:hypothetical protein
LTVKLNSRELRKHFGRGGNQDELFNGRFKVGSGQRTYQFQIVKSGINKVVYESKRYNDVVMMEEMSLKKSSRYDSDHYYCIQYITGRQLDYQLAEWIYEQKLNCPEYDEAQQAMCDDMCKHEDEAGGEVFPC